LLAPDSEIGARISVDTLSAFILQIETAVTDHYRPLLGGNGLDLLVRCFISPGRKAKFEVLTRPDADRDVLQGLYDRLTRLVVPAIKDGQVPFQIEMAIWGGSGLAPRAAKPR
jgi:hypothetical protein